MELSSELGEKDDVEMETKLGSGEGEVAAREDRILWSLLVLSSSSGAPIVTGGAHPVNPPVDQSSERTVRGLGWVQESRTFPRTGGWGGGDCASWEQ